MPGASERRTNGHDNRWGTLEPPASDAVIKLTGLAAHGHHGVYQSERDMGQPFKVDLELLVDLAAAAQTDDFSLTVDYAQLARQVIELITGPPCYLIEALALKIANQVLGNSRVRAVEVTVHKPQAPLGVNFEDVAVTLRRLQPIAPGGIEPATDSAVQVAPTSDQRPPAVAVFPGINPWADPPERLGAWPRSLLPAPPDQVPTRHLPAGPALANDGWHYQPAPPAEAGRSHHLAEPAIGTDTVPSPRAPENPFVPAHRATAPARRRPRRAPDSVLDGRPGVLVEAIVAMGANVGDSLATLRNAVQDLDSEPGVWVVAAAPLARTQAVGAVGQADYFNAVLRVRTSLSARQLLRVLMGVEQAHGRQRTVRWGPRTLDLDLVTYGALVASDTEVTVPHPRAHQRAFVLLPWSQMTPLAMLPGPDGGLVAQLADAAPDRPGVRWLAPDWLGFELQPEPEVATDPVPRLKVVPALPPTPPSGVPVAEVTNLAQAI